MADKYRLNPYDGDIFPGQDIKLFRDATKELAKDDRFSLVDSDPISIAIAFAEASSHFHWNKTCTIPTVYDNTGVGSTFVDMIRNPEDLTLQQVRDAAAITWTAVNYVSKSYTRDVLKINPATTDSDRPTFQRRARSEIIVSWIRGHFDEESLKALSLKSDDFQWTVPADDGGGVKCDGPTMIKLILDYIQPSTMIGTDRYRKVIQNCRLEKHGHNVLKAMEQIETALKQIERKGETYDSLRLHVFDCLNSTKNSDFREWVRRVRADIGCGKGEYSKHDGKMIIKDAKEQYANMSDNWNQLDPRDAQMLALATKLQSAEAKFVLLTNAAANSNNNPNNKGPGGTGGKGSGPEDWQYVKEGDTKTVYGKTWWWCERHNDGKGLYVRHPPSDHDEWKRCKKSGEFYKQPDARKTPDPDPNTTNTPTNVPSTSTLELGEEMKQVLASYGMSYADAEDAWQVAKERVSKN
jgi:hypothetical protein